MKYLIFLLFASVAIAQTEFQVRCENGYCIMRESDLVRLQSVINALVNRIHELQERGGCS